MIRLVACDMDGTLLDSQKEISVNMKYVIEELKNRGVFFTAASGRSRDSILSYFGDVPISIIANNGGTAYLEDGSLLFSGEFTYDKAMPVMEAARSASYMHLVLIGVNHTYVQWDDPEEHKAFANYYFNNKVKVVPSLRQVFLTDRIVKISINTGGHGRNEKRGMELMGRFADEFTLVLSGDGWVDLMGKGVSKGYGVKKLCEHYGITMDETIVFGDYLNDLEMLKQSPNSYAMANAHPDIKKICKYVTRYTNDNDGVVRELADIFGIVKKSKKSWWDQGEGVSYTYER